MSKIRILSLDGGGSNAGVHARTLGRLYGPDTPGRDIIRRFDFVAGNSGGSIVLTALCCNYTPHQIAEFYNDPATLRRMYSPKWISAIPLLRCILPRYSAKGKFEALKWIFDRNRQNGEPLPSDIKMANWKDHLKKDVNLLVTAFDYDRERAAFFRSNRGSPTKSSTRANDPTLVEAVHASTNAPIRYYDEPAEFGGRRYWDGAMGGYNNPVLAAVVEAMAGRPDVAHNFRVLSLGVGTCAKPLSSDKPSAPPPLGKVPEKVCLLNELRKAATVIFGDPPDVATFHAYVTLRQPLPPKSPGETGRIVRLCPLLRPIFDEKDGDWRLPEGLCISEFQALFKLRLDAMKPRDLELIRKLCDLWFADAISNQPIRMGEKMRADIGHDTFSQAAAHWHSISA
jgi:predicted acylesterase/phospholipase RssA